MLSTPALLTVEEAAEALRYGRTFMYRLIREGKIDSVKVGKLRRIPAAAIQEYVEDLRSTQTGA